MFQIAETDTFTKVVKKRNFDKILNKIHSNIYPILRKGPFFGPNIKKLKGKLAGIYRYRIGDYRLFYSIDESNKTIFILEITHRKDAH